MLKITLSIGLFLFICFEIIGQTFLSDYHIYPGITNNSPSVAHRFNTDHGYIDVGPRSTSWAHIYSDRPKFIFNKDVYNQGGFYGTYYIDISIGPHNNEVLTISYGNENTGLRLSDPAHDFHVHGIHDYVTSINQTSMDEQENQLEESVDAGSRSTTNYGKASCIGLTNTNTGQGKTDGGLLMQADDDMYLWNRENGKLRLVVPGVSLELSGVENRIFSGLQASGLSRYGRFNIQTSNDNGLYVRTTSSSKSAITAIAHDNQATFVSYSNSDINEPNFKVRGDGEVFARKYTTTLNSFPDYVFEEDYKLMTLNELRSYIHSEKHLPNMPTAAEIEENGADMGEINRILVEKVEELTLYILDLEERLSELENRE